MRIVYSLLSFVSIYIISACFKSSVIAGLVTYILYIPIPFNVDNFFATYVTLKSLSIGELMGWIKLKLGMVTELAMRRAGVDAIRPKLHRGVSMRVKKMENYDLHIFTPEVISES